MTTPILIYWNADPGDPLSLIRIDSQFLAFDSMLNLIGEASIQDKTWDWYHLPTLYASVSDTSWTSTNPKVGWAGFHSAAEGAPLTTICNTFISYTDSTMVLNGVFAPGWTLVSDANTALIDGPAIDMNYLTEGIQGIFVTAAIYFGNVNSADIDFVYGALQVKGNDDVWRTVPRSVRAIHVARTDLFAVIDSLSHYEIDILLTMSDMAFDARYIKGIRLVAACDATSVATTIEINNAYISATMLYAPVNP